MAKEPFWNRKTKLGRDILFSSPELLWEEACDYFKYCDDNPWTKTEWVGKDAKKVLKPTQRPYTWSGLCLYLDCAEAYFRNFKNAQGCTPEFLTVIDRIAKVIKTQQLEGAVVGTFNANIVSRINGIAEVTDNKNTNINSKELTAEEIKEINQKLEDEY